MELHEAFKKVIVENEGYAFHKLNKMFWESVIDASLDVTNGKKTKAAEMLGISRATFKTHMDRIK